MRKRTTRATRSEREERRDGGREQRTAKKGVVAVACEPSAAPGRRASRSTIVQAAAARGWLKATKNRCPARGAAGRRSARCAATGRRTRTRRAAPSAGGKERESRCRRRVLLPVAVPGIVGCRRACVGRNEKPEAGRHVLPAVDARLVVRRRESAGVAAAAAATALGSWRSEWEARGWRAAAAAARPAAAAAVAHPEGRLTGTTAFEHGHGGVGRGSLPAPVPPSGSGRRPAAARERRLDRRRNQRARRTPRATDARPATPATEPGARRTRRTKRTRRTTTRRRRRRPPDGLHRNSAEYGGGRTGGHSPDVVVIHSAGGPRGRDSLAPPGPLPHAPPSTAVQLVAANCLSLYV